MKAGVDYRPILSVSRGADLLIHDAEFKNEEEYKQTRGWGHSFYKDALNPGDGCRS